ncbi:GTP cyclohydrolase I [Amnibacterium kyonggiense]|uniref:GTP cyclohydrolase 1 n=1 Tax=Amnibacterium kyonggiense TaxID=595671 RepID=A0A4R7FQ49_9MICO|nr:GTP cyclohydrolase I [Amnibacterium kyonggiense]TDS79895.1 GTP cyclohydrolase I [Amnibacterium kyonggiense]
MTPDLERAQRAVEEYLRALGLDPADPSLDRTPERVARLGAELFAGVGVDPVPDLAASAVADTDARGPVAFLDIPFRSTCEHHLLKFAGAVSLVYRPGAVAGLGAIVRVIETIAARPQVQERLTDEIAFALEHGLGATGVLVTAVAEHDCVAIRGPRIRGATVRTLAARGAYAVEPTAAEARSLVGLA